MPIKDKQKRREYNKEYRERNKEQLHKKRKEWEHNNKEVLREYHKEYHQNWYLKNKNKRQEQIREYSKQHPEDNVKRTKKYVQNHKEKVQKYGSIYSRTISGAYRSYKSTSKKKGRSFGISIEEFGLLVTRPCTYCGQSKSQNGIDRIDNNSGYEIKNCAPCCKICNYMKKTMTVNEFISHIHKISTFNTP